MVRYCHSGGSRASNRQQGAVVERGGGNPQHKRTPEEKNGHLCEEEMELGQKYRDTYV